MRHSLRPDLGQSLAALAMAGSSPQPILELLLATTEDGVAITDLTGSSIYFNDAARRILGLTGIDRPIDIRTHGADLYYLHDFTSIPEDELPLVRALRGEDTRDAELFVRAAALPDGALICLNARPIRNADGRVIGGAAVFRDVGARKRAEEELRVTNAKLASWVQELERRAHQTLLMNDMADLLQSCLSMKEFYVVVSRFAERIFEREPGAVYVVNASRSAIEMVTSWGEVPLERIFAPHGCWALRRGRMHYAGGTGLGPDCEHASSDGTAGYTCVPMMGQGEALGILYVRNPAESGEPATALETAAAESRTRSIVSVAEHIALALANLKLRESLRIQAIRDPLTGLFNRRYMEESLEREVVRASRSGRSLAAIMVDIDHFKRYNDTFGHAAADLALRETANTIRASLRADDIACRYGGEEILLILPDVTAEQALARAETIRVAVAEQQLSFNGTPLGAVTASFGVALCPQHAAGVETVLRAADEALYLAKRGGRNRVCISGAPVEGDTQNGAAATSPASTSQGSDKESSAHA